MRCGRGAWVASVVLAACGDPAGPVPVALVVTASDTIQVTGRTLTFTAEAVDRAGTPVPGVTITWSVSDTLRGTITAGGVFTAHDSGRVFIRAMMGAPPLAESVTVRVVAPGTVKWTWAAAEAGNDLPQIGGPALGTDGTVYVVVNRSHQPALAALVALTSGGLARWILPLDLVKHDYPVVTVTGDVLVAGTQVYVVEADGTVRWQAVMEATTPTFNSSAADDELAFVSYGARVIALRLATGDTVWQSPPAPLGTWLVPPTIVGQDLVYAKHTADTLFVFRRNDGTILKTFLDPDTALDKSVFGAGTVPVGDRFYLPTVFRLAAFDTAGPLLWLTDEMDVGTPEPVIDRNGVLYVQNARWGLQALNPDGSTRWYQRHASSDGYRWWEEPRWTWYGGGALAQGGIIYGAGWDRFLAYDTAGTPLWQYLSDSAGVPQAFIGSPAIGPDGTVYTYTSTHVYAFWGAAPPEPNSPWPMWRHDAQRTGWAR
jgi:hypothetical protein